MVSETPNSGSLVRHAVSLSAPEPVLAQFIVTSPLLGLTSHFSHDGASAQVMRPFSALTTSSGLKLQCP